MEEQQKWAVEMRGTLKECFQQIRFARAVELARSRRYLEAEGLLAPNGRVPSDPKELDLLARIAAQQRRFDQARRLWDAALRLSPNNSDYQRAIQRAEAAEHAQQIWRKSAVIALAVVTAVALVLAVVNFLASRTPAPKQTPKDSKASNAPAQQRQLPRAPQPSQQPSQQKQVPPPVTPQKR